MVYAYVDDLVLWNFLLKMFYRTNYGNIWLELVYALVANL